LTRSVEHAVPRILAKPDRLIGYNIVSLDAKMGKGIEYQDNMIYKID